MTTPITSYFKPNDRLHGVGADEVRSSDVSSNALQHEQESFDAPSPSRPTNNRNAPQRSNAKERRGRPRKQPAARNPSATNTLDAWIKGPSAGNASPNTVPSTARESVDARREHDGAQAAPVTMTSVDSHELNSNAQQSGSQLPLTASPGSTRSRKAKSTSIPGADQTTLESWRDGGASTKNDERLKRAYNTAMRRLPRITDEAELRKDKSVIQKSGSTITQGQALKFYWLNPSELKGLAFNTKETKLKALAHIYLEQDVEFRAWQIHGGYERFIEYLFFRYYEWPKQSAEQDEGRAKFPVSEWYRPILTDMWDMWLEELDFDDKVKGYEAMAEHFDRMEAERQSRKALEMDRQATVPISGLTT